MILVSGITSIAPPRSDIRIINVVTAEEMRTAVMAGTGKVLRSSSRLLRWPTTDAAEESCVKIKKKDGKDELTLTLRGKPRIYWRSWGRYAATGSWWALPRRRRMLCENAFRKLKKKQLDLIVANDVAKEGIGFGSEENEVTLIDRTGLAKRVPRLSKDEVAQIILDAVQKILKKKRKVEEDWY